MEEILELNDHDLGDGDILYQNDDSEVPLDNTFDMTLATSHSYLGDNLQVLRGRTLLDNGIYVNLPLWPPESTQPRWLVLFPGGTLPIVARNSRPIEMLRQCIAKDRTFGVVCVRDVNSVGTTAEIYEYTEESLMHGLEEVRVKAKGRQRFKIIRIKNTTGRIPVADVRILPEVELGAPNYESRIASLDRLRGPTTDRNIKRLNKVAKIDSAITPWPSWVYHLYDPNRLSAKIHNYLKFLQSKGGNIPSDPTELSFWVAQNLVITPKTALSLLEIDSVIFRLQREEKLLRKLANNIFVCKRCGAKVARQTDVFQMNEEGVQSAYCNPAGAIHETITLHKAQSLVLDNAPASTEYSWFPGYAWTIAHCGGCRFHMGWRFTATRRDLKPQSFWGLTRTSLAWGERESHYCDEWDSDDENNENNDQSDTEFLPPYSNIH
ncbi:protein cereblon isoform X2 [Microplitis demolitor]|nr:protein cereblon isoform X2 [Microplitis demolitor]XP_008558966.1 protein cereblon isoform X2 [Microplitis demolitor]XP_008558967.1 protein cereblon isoform X2 [Microplitis demolitor]